MNIQRLAVMVAFATCFPVAMAAQPAANGSGGYKAKTERGQLSQQIVKKWAGYVSRVYGTEPGLWARSMAGTFAEADVSNMRKAAQKGTYEAMMGNLLGKPIQDAEIIDKLARSNGSVDVVKSLGSNANDLTYNMIAPCRIADTRVAGGRLSAGVVRSFTSSGADFNAQGGAANNCGMPADASAVTVNVTSVTADGPGYLTLFPYNTTRPTASNLNYKGADIVANEIIVKQTLGQPFDFSVFSLVGTDVVIDIVGYFMAPQATPLDCISVFETPTNRDIAANFNSFFYTTATCPAGYSVSSANCWTGGAAGVYSGGSGINGGAWCHFVNSTAVAKTVRVGATCCRVPGR